MDALSVATDLVGSKNEASYLVYYAGSEATIFVCVGLVATFLVCCRNRSYGLRIFTGFVATFLVYA
jgi:hypothetical protein